MPGINEPPRPGEAGIVIAGCRILFLPPDEEIRCDEVHLVSQVHLRYTSIHPL